MQSQQSTVQFPSQTQRPSSASGIVLRSQKSTLPGLSCSLSASSLGGRPNSSSGIRHRADPHKVWRAPHEIKLLPLPPLAKGMSRHRMPGGAKPKPPVLAVVPKPRVNLQDIDTAGREAIGDEHWWKVLFKAVDGNDNGFVTPGEFAALASRLGDELGESSSGFKFSFQAADIRGDGRLGLAEWQRYAKVVEREFGQYPCIMAAWRFLGRREAEPRKKIKNIFMTDGYNQDSSLQLLTLCSKCDNSSLYDQVCKLVEHAADPNCALASISYNGYTPLIFLAMANSTVEGGQVADCIKLLITAKADVHRESDGGKGTMGRLVPLRFAAQLQNEKGLAALLNSIDVGDRFSWAAGEHVEHVMREELSKICLHQTMSRVMGKARYSAQATILLIMFASPLVGGKLTASGARKLLQGEYSDGNMQQGSFADPNGKGIDGTTALMWVAKTGNLDVVKVLLEGMASPDQQDSEGATPLIFAASNLHTGVVAALLEAGADPSVTDHSGFSAYMLVGEEKHANEKEDQASVKDTLSRSQIFEMLTPKIDPESIISMLERNWEDVVGESGVDPDMLQKEFRLHESLFFNPLTISRNTSEGRNPRLKLLERIANVMMEFLKTDPLKGEKKKLTKYLLTATMGPVYNLSSHHVSAMWPVADNRHTYGQDLKDLVKNLLDGFASDCDHFRNEIEKDAADNADGVCAALRALPKDQVDVPQDWQDESEHWRVVQERQLLRYDPEWACGVHDGATCCLALLRLGHVEDLAEYSALLQVHHRPMEELMAGGYVEYSDLCNVPFQELMVEVARKIQGTHTLDITFPSGVIGVKRLKRLSEKTREARAEHALMEWPGKAENYLKFSHCFYILDTVRLSFVCNGNTMQDEVSCCLKILNGFLACTVEKDGLQVLRQKSGFAAGVQGSGGYADVKMLIYAELGVHHTFDGTPIPLRIIGEVQVILNSYQTVKDRMHLAYEVARGSFEPGESVAPSLDAT